MAEPVIERAAAKINLDLHVTGRRPDHYHELDSLVVFAGIGDELIFEPAQRLALTIDGPQGGQLDAGPDNLVWRAAVALARAIGRPPAVAIRLTKHLPVAAGIGGGSADAAATLRGLVRLWGLSMQNAHLAELALELGADVPVCLAGRPARLRGIGEQLAPLTGWPPLHLVLATPRAALASKRVFAERASAEGGPRAAAVPMSPDAMGVARYLAQTRNDLEPTAMRLVPLIAEVLSRLENAAGCRLARMSGSGSTCFGIFGSAAAAELASTELAAAQPGWWVTTTMTGGTD